MPRSHYGRRRVRRLTRANPDLTVPRRSAKTGSSTSRIDRSDANVCAECHYKAGQHSDRCSQTPRRDRTEGDRRRRRKAKSKAKAKADRLAARRHACPDCGRRFKDPDALGQHHRAKHDSR